MRKCRWCKREFKPSKKHRFFCSEECYKNNRRKIRKEYSKNYRRKYPERVKEGKKRWYLSGGQKKIKDYYQKNRERLNSARQLWIKKRRIFIINQLGGKCQNPNCSTPNGYSRCLSALEFHHVNPDEKENNDDWKRKDFDISKIKLLCATCHIEEHERIREQND